MILSIALFIAGSPLRLEGKWAAPAQIPFERVHAIVKTPGDYYVAGIKGLARGGPGSWKAVDERPVRQMVHVGEAIWVLFGDGSVDKIEYKQDRLVFDALAGRVKRPWGSCLGSDTNTLLVGSQGGWFGLGGVASETYRKEFDKEVLTTICKFDNALWLGTQRNGLFSYRGGEVKRFGFAAGLPDSWVTATAVLSNEMIVGVADGGLVRMSKNKLHPMDCPVRKVRHLAVFGQRLAVGGMEGCWIKTESDWQQLSQEETTFLNVIDDKLAVGTPTGLSWWR